MNFQDPTIARGQLGVVTALDLVAFDAIGWNLSLDALGNPGYRITTSEIFTNAFGPAAVPEPSTWAMLIGGFGLIGGALRRRKRAVRALA